MDDISKVERWNRLIAAIQNDMPRFEIRFKEENLLQKAFGYLSVWSWSKDPKTKERIHGYMSMTTTMGDQVWFPSVEDVNARLPANTLEHEWVHMKDSETFFSALPFMPAIFNRTLFSIAYIGVFPWPGIFRAYAELRAYRRSLELTPAEHREEALEFYTEQFTGPNYFYMWPFKNQIYRLLQEPSPYKELMDKARN